MFADSAASRQSFRKTINPIAAAKDNMENTCFAETFAM
jgi:hypothetical protein